jgi:hypothetical protein
VARRRLARKPKLRIRTKREWRLSGLRHLRNSITLAQLPAVSSPLSRYRLFYLRFKYL